MKVDPVLNRTLVESKCLNDEKIIRKMGAFEKYFHDEVELNSIINASTFIFSTKFDLFANKDVISQSVSYWKQTQPFLCSRVVELDQANMGFAYTSEEKIKNADNITYLYFNDNNSTTNVTDCKDYWKLLIEREFTIPIGKLYFFNNLVNRILDD